MSLADRLDGVVKVGNLCKSRVGFLVTWLAALRRGCVQLLPPSVGPAELAGMPWNDQDCRIVIDEADTFQQPWAEHARCILLSLEPPHASFSGSQLAWSPDLVRPLVNLFTSGSTGAPEPQLKSLGQLMLGGRVLAARLDSEIDGGLPALRQIVCSVPPQHMFGVEASVILSLVLGIPVLERRPLLPADVRSAIEGGAEGTIWIATPLHLRAIVQTGDAIAGCSAVVASTMPLAQTLAALAEGLVKAPVLEIYGSTETGAIAMRRTAHTAGWRPLDGVSLTQVADGVQTWGTHFSSPQTLADQIEFESPGTFRLLGRQNDLIKIAGRRASLAGLNLLLLEMPGLKDGVFYLPATDAPAERLVLFHSGSGLDRAKSVEWLRERMDPVFVPRTFIHVDQLPRTATGKLPRSALDEIYRTWLSDKASR